MTTGADEFDPSCRAVFHRETHYLVTESDLDRIDTLIGALCSAVTEILTRRRVRHDPLAPTPAQDDFSDLVHEIVSGPLPPR